MGPMRAGAQRRIEGNGLGEERVRTTWVVQIRELRLRRRGQRRSRYAARVRARAMSLASIVSDGRVSCCSWGGAVPPRGPPSPGLRAASLQVMRAGP